MSKFCTNGHQLEDSWEVCPYCQKTGYAVAAASDAKTRMEAAPPPSVLPKLPQSLD